MRAVFCSRIRKIAESSIQRVNEGNPAPCVTSVAKSELLLQVAGWFISVSLDDLARMTITTMLLAIFGGLLVASCAERAATCARWISSSA